MSSFELSGVHLKAESSFCFQNSVFLLRFGILLVMLQNGGFHGFVFKLSLVPLCDEFFIKTFLMFIAFIFEGLFAPEFLFVSRRRHIKVFFVLC
jgi:hypothetical protein